MKKILSMLLIALMMIPALTSCNSDDDPQVTELTPYVIFVDVTDGNQSLLNPNNPMNILNRPMTITVDGTTTNVAVPTTKPIFESASSRALPANWFGASVGVMTATGYPYIIIGEFEGQGKYEKTIILDLNGRTYTIKVFNDSRIEYGDQLTFNRKFYLDGHELNSSSGMFRIVIPNE